MNGFPPWKEILKDLQNVYLTLRQPTHWSRIVFQPKTFLDLGINKSQRELDLTDKMDISTIRTTFSFTFPFPEHLWDSLMIQVYSHESFNRVSQDDVLTLFPIDAIDSSFWYRATWFHLLLRLSHVQSGGPTFHSKLQIGT